MSARFSTAELHQLLKDNDGKYGLNAEESKFYHSQTGIQDDNGLRKHIFKVREEAYMVHPYPCIRRFNFTKLKISRLPVYEQLLTLGKKRKGAILLDIGCCFGNDVRKAIVDGYPRENVIASDLQAAYWALGHKLFRTTKDTFPVPFVAGDAFDPNFIKPVSPFYSSPGTPRPDLRSLTSLTPLLGHISAIHASSVFHLFDEAPQTQLAHSLAGLLSAEPGSMIFGMHVGQPTVGFRGPIRADHAPRMFCHSPESWTELWDGKIFKKGTVKVNAELIPRAEEEDGKHFNLVWSVTRL